MIYEVTYDRKKNNVKVRSIYAVTLLQNGLHSFEEEETLYPGCMILNIAEGYVVAQGKDFEKLNFESEQVKLILPKAITTIIFK